MTLRMLTSADHSNVFVGLDVPLNQALYMGVRRERLRPLCATRDNQELEIALGGIILSEIPSDNAEYQLVRVRLGQTRHRRRTLFRASPWR